MNDKAMTETGYWRLSIEQTGSITATDDLGLQWWVGEYICSENVLAHCLPQTAKLVREYISLRKRLTKRLLDTESGSPESDSILDDIKELEDDYRSQVAATQAAETRVPCGEQEG